MRRVTTSATETTRTTDDRLLTVRQAAERLAVSPVLVRRMGLRGVLPRVKLGRPVRYRASDVARIIADGVPRSMN